MNKKLFSLVTLVCIMAFNLVFVSCGNNLNGKWIAEGYDNNGIQFSGKKFTLSSNSGATANFMGGNKRAQDGTYSISNNQIEFSFSDGRIEVQPFSRTEKTITIGRTRLLKK